MRRDERSSTAVPPGLQESRRRSARATMIASGAHYWFCAGVRYQVPPTGSRRLNRQENYQIVRVDLAATAGQR
jgi:hypothetical protein